MTDSPAGERKEIAIGLKCNDCGRRYEWNRNIGRRRKCEECGCTLLELWGSFVAPEIVAKWPKARQRWAEENQIVVGGIFKP